MHYASSFERADTCTLLCAFDDENAVDKFDSESALRRALNDSQAATVRALLELNVDTSTAVCDDETFGEIVQLLDEHRKRSVEEKILRYFFR